MTDHFKNLAMTFAAMTLVVWMVALFISGKGDPLSDFITSAMFVGFISAPFMAGSILIRWIKS